MSESPGRIRIMMCLHSLELGGTELNTLRTIELLKDGGFDIHLACLRQEGGLLQRFENAVTVTAFPAPNSYGWISLNQRRSFVKLLHDRCIDIVHSHDVYSNIFAAPAARLAGVRGVITSQRWWQELPRPGLRHLNRFATRWAHCVVTNSQTVQTLLHARYRVCGPRVVHIPNFLEDEAFDMMPAEQRKTHRHALGIPPRAPIIGVVARLAPVKDHPTVIQALALVRQAIPDVHLVLVGDGPDRNNLQELTRTLLLEQAVHFAGTQPFRPSWHALFDVSVLASRSEAFPNSLLEAMAVGCPVVATAAGGIPELVRDGHTGYVVEVGDSGSLAERIIKLLRDRDLRATMGHRGRALVTERYRATSTLVLLRNLYEGLCR